MTVTTAEIRKIEKSEILELSKILDGNVVTPENEIYEEERKVWNGQIDRYPSIIIKCNSTADVVKALKFAKRNNLDFVVRAGGHHVAGKATIDNGIIIDLKEMKGIDVDPEKKIAVAEAGLTLGELDQATQKYGLATPAGVVSATGISGLTLGGGYGWLRRKYGLTSDNVIEFEVVTAEGGVIKANNNDHTDLYWALRGGGGNFGIVTKFTYKLFDIGNELFMSIVFYAAKTHEQAKDVLLKYFEYVKTAPKEVSSMAILGRIPANHEFPEEIHGQKFVLALSVYAGNPKEGQEMMKPLHGFGEILVDFSSTLPFLDIQQFFDADYPDGGHYYWSSLYYDDIGDYTLDVLIENGLHSPSQITTVDIWHLGGAISENTDGGAVPYRDAKFLLGFESNWKNIEDSAENIKWNKEIRNKLISKSRGSGYINFPSGEDETEPSNKRVFELLHDKLLKIKKDYDPKNLFKGHINLKEQST